MQNATDLHRLPTVRPADIVGGMNALVLAFDSLPVSLLGCYGNQTAATPNFDRLAAEAALFDFHFGDCFVADVRHSSWWTGCNEFFRNDDEPTELPSVSGLLAEAGVTTTLIAEAQSGQANRFAPPVTQNVIADGPDSFEQLISISRDAVQRWASSDCFELLWLQANGLASSSGTTMSAAEAAQQVHRCDEQLGQLLDAIDTLDVARQPLFVLTAAAGKALIDRDAIADESFDLHEELVHTPLFLRDPMSPLGGQRINELVQTTDLAPTLLDWFRGGDARHSFEGISLLPCARGESFPGREFVSFGGRFGDAVLGGIRSRDFYLIRRITGSGLHSVETALFLKPDDIWEVSNVASQWPDVVAMLTQKLEDAERGIRRETALPSESC